MAVSTRECITLPTGKSKRFSSQVTFLRSSGEMRQFLVKDVEVTSWISLPEQGDELQNWNGNVLIGWLVFDPHGRTLWITFTRCPESTKWDEFLLEIFLIVPLPRKIDLSSLILWNSRFVVQPEWHLTWTNKGCPTSSEFWTGSLFLKFSDNISRLAYLLCTPGSCTLWTVDFSHCTSQDHQLNRPLSPALHSFIHLTMDVWGYQDFHRKTVLNKMLGLVVFSVFL